MNKIRRFFRTICNYFRVEEVPPIQKATTEQIDYPSFIARMAEKAGDCFIS